MTASVHCTLKGAWSLSEQLCSIFIFNLGRCPGFQVTSTVVNLNSIQRSLFTETPLSCLPQIHHLIVNYPLKNVQARPINLYSGFYNSYSCPRPYFFEITELYSTKNCREHWVSLHRKLWSRESDRLCKETVVFRLCQTTFAQPEDSGAWGPARVGDLGLLSFPLPASNP